MKNGEWRMKNEEWRIRGGPHFGTFWVLGPPKVFIFDRFYKGFRHFENAMRKAALGNAFSMILEPIFRKWLENDQFEQGFIRVFATRFCISQNVEFDRFYNGFRRAGKVLRKPSLGNAFLMILSPFPISGSKNLKVRQVFIRLFATHFCTLEIAKFRWRYWVSGRFANALRKHYDRNAFWSFPDPFSEKGPQSLHFRQVL